MSLIFMTVQQERRPSSDVAAFREEFAKSKHLVVLTGAGVSAESGVPTFRGAGGFWRKWQAQVGSSSHMVKETEKLQTQLLLCCLALIRSVLSYCIVVVRHAWFHASWKVLDFFLKISGPGKSWKIILESHAFF